MKCIRILVALLLLIFKASFACELNSPHRHSNPDGSIGGLVSSTSRVEATAYVAYDAKICDGAWIEGNARVLGEAKIKENAWIRDNAIINEHAIVGGSAIVWGVSSQPAVVQGHSVVSGSAKILAGSLIEDRAEISGNTSLYGVTAAADAKICEGLILKDILITDDYFCSLNEVESRAVINLVSHRTDYFNPGGKKLVFETSNFEFAKNPNIFQITVNGSLVSIENINLSLRRLVVSNVILADGENEILISGRDEFNKKITQKSFTVFVGNATKFIDIQDVNEENFSVQVAYEYLGRNFSGNSKVLNGQLVLEGFPETLDEVKIKVFGVGSKHYFSESFSSPLDIPFSIVPSNTPDFSNNNFDFRNGLDGWSISHPMNVILVGTGESARADIYPLTDERVELSKTFKLDVSSKALKFDFGLYSSLVRQFSEEERVEVIIFSRSERTIETFNYNLQELSLFKKDKSGIVNFDVQLMKKLEKAGEFSVVLRLSPIAGSDFRESPLASIFGLEPLNVIVGFIPKNLAPKIESGQVTPTFPAPVPTWHIPPTNPENESKCEDKRFLTFPHPNIEQEAEDQKKIEMEYFSGGTVPLLSGIFSENRIFGDLFVRGVPKSRIVELRIVGEQYGQVVFTHRMSTCTQYKLRLDTSEQPQHRELNIAHSSSLTNYLFAIPASKLAALHTVVFQPPSLEPANAKIDLYVEADVQDGLVTRTFKSPKKTKTMLASPNLVLADFTYKPDMKVEDYDSRGGGLVLTGGDKWVQPIYASILTQMMSLFTIPGGTEWKLNDISKLNGGQFLGHGSHRHGLDVDIMLPLKGDSAFNTRHSHSENEWVSYLEKIEDFLETSKTYVTYIEDYYFSYATLPEVSKKHLENRFLNRCISDRFVRFSKINDGSLFTDIDPHSDHLHLNFLGPDTNGVAKQRAKEIPSNVKISHFVFSLDSSDQLTIEPLPEFESLYTNRRLLWRLQNKKKSGDIGIRMNPGSWTQGKAIMDDFRKPFTLKDNSMKYIYLTVATIGTGWCIAKEIEIDQNVLLRKNRMPVKWKYLDDQANSVEFLGKAK